MKKDPEGFRLILDALVDLAEKMEKRAILAQGRERTYTSYL